MKMMKPFRDRIDELDDQIVDLLTARTNIIREVGQFKFDNNIPCLLPDRIEAVKNRVCARAEDKDLDSELVRRLYSILIDYSCDLEEDIKQELIRKNKKATG